MAKPAQEMHVVRLRIQTTEYEESLFAKRFHALSHVHNVMVKQAKKRIIRLEHDHEHQEMRAAYVRLLKLPKESVTPDIEKQKKALSRQMNRNCQKYGISEYDFQKYLAACGRQYRTLLSSQQVQKEASRVFWSVEHYLYGKGKEIHFKPYRNFNTIGGKSNRNGIRFDPKSRMIRWLGDTFPCLLPKDRASRDYVLEALNADIAYCDLKRLMFPNGWHYYVVIVLRGPAPRKLTVGTGTTGIDPGVSTMACVSDEQASLFELAPGAKKYNPAIRKLQQQMEASKRLSNPDRYRADGTYIKGSQGQWTFSKRYFRVRDRLKSLYRQKTAYTQDSHRQQINRLLADSRTFIVEDMNYLALAKKSKNTIRQDHPSIVTDKKGCQRVVYKYRRRKRFGKSMNSRSPGAFLSRLEEKAALYGGTVIRIHTKEFRASQYDHAADTRQRIPLTQRSKIVDGHKVQRDLYSAFLIRNTDDSLNHPDREKCFAEFPGFLRMQRTCIDTMKQNHQSMPQCFGF